MKVIYIALLVFYVALVLAEMYHRHWLKAAYWIGAIIVTMSVMFMETK